MKYIYFNIQNIKNLDCFHTNFNGPDSLSSKSDKCLSRTGTNIHKQTNEHDGFPTSKGKKSNKNKQNKKLFFKFRTRKL
jgi:hypothetical protein